MPTRGCDLVYYGMDRCRSARGIPLGTVENLHDVSWREVTIDSDVNQAG